MKTEALCAFDKGLADASVTFPWDYSSISSKNFAMEFQSTEMAVQMRPPQMEATAIPEEQATNNYLENSTLDAENTGKPIF